MSINLYHGDCIEHLLSVEDNFYDIAIVDPPYGINVNMNAGRKRDTKSSKRTIKKWDSQTPSQEYFDELFRVSKNQIIWGANHMIDKIKKNSQGWIFWDKCVAEGCSFSDGELAWTSFNMSLKKITVPWSGFIGMEGEKFHPTTKPIALYEKLFDLFVKDSDRVLDTHGGSMSIAIAAYNKKKNLDVFEIDEEYFNKASERYYNHVRKMEEIKEFGYAKSEISKSAPLLF